MSVANYIMNGSGANNTFRALRQLKATDSEAQKSTLKEWIHVDSKRGGTTASLKVGTLSKTDSGHETDEDDARQKPAGGGKSAAPPAAVLTKISETAHEVEAREDVEPGIDKPPLCAGGAGLQNKLLEVGEDDLCLRKKQIEANNSIYRGLAHALIRNNRYDEALSCLPRREHATENMDTLLLMAECEHYLGKVNEADRTIACFNEGVRRCGTPSHQLFEWGDDVSTRGRHLAALIVYRSVYHKHSSGKLEDRVALYYVVVAKMFMEALEMFKAARLSRLIVSKLVITWMEEIAIKLETEECVDTDRRAVAFARCLSFTALLHHKTGCFEGAIRCGKGALVALGNLCDNPNHRQNSTAGDIFYTMSLACRSENLHLYSEKYRKFAIDEYERATDFEDESRRQECLESLRSGLGDWAFCNDYVLRIDCE